MKIRFAIDSQIYPINVDDTLTLNHILQDFLGSHSHPSIAHGVSSHNFSIVSDLSGRPLPKNIALKATGIRANTLLRIFRCANVHVDRSHRKLAFHHPNGTRLHGTFPPDSSLWEVLKSVETKDCCLTANVVQGVYQIPILSFPNVKFSTLQTLCRTILFNLDLDKSGTLVRVTFENSEIDPAEVDQISRKISKDSLPEPLEYTPPSTSQLRSDPLSDSDPTDEMKEWDEKSPRVYFGRIERMLYHLHKELLTHDATTRSKVVQILFTIVKNIVKHPEDAKYRKLNSDSKVFTRLNCVRSAYPFLLALGFDENGSDIVMQDSSIYVDTLKKALLKLHDLKNAVHEAPKVSQIHMIHAKSEMDKDKDKEIEAIDPHAHLHVFFVSSEAANDTLHRLRELDEEEDPYDLVLIRKVAAESKKRANNIALLQSQSKFEEKEQQQRPTFSHVNVRLKFADGLVIQTKFSDSSKIRDIADFLQTLSTHELGGIFFQVPPSREFELNSSETLKAAGLIPAVSFQVLSTVDRTSVSYRGLIENSIINSAGDNPDLKIQEAFLEKVEGPVRNSHAEPNPELQTNSTLKNKKAGFSKFVKL